jgi:hypothetical protein
MQRSTVLRSLYRSASKAGGRPPRLPRRARLARWSAGCRDGGLDAAPAQLRADLSAGVGLVGQHPAGSDPGTAAAAAADPNPVQYGREGDRWSACRLT